MVVNLMKILFVCSKNKWRSPTAEKIFHGVNGCQARSAGTEPGARVRLNEGHIGWADIIFVMEKKHLRRLREKFGFALEDKRIICLNIEDDYGYMDEELIHILKSTVSQYIEGKD
jgi:predicted protein tyrosine phosphatase